MNGAHHANTDCFCIAIKLDTEQLVNRLFLQAVVYLITYTTACVFGIIYCKILKVPGATLNLSKNTCLWFKSPHTHIQISKAKYN